SFRRLAARRHDVAVLHLLDPTEVDFAYDTPSFFVSMEDTRRLFVHPRTLRSAFVNEMRAFLTRTARALSEASIFYHAVHTDTPPAQALAAFLRGREQRR
ncbi:MAG TPA: DUF58 domain-containing protein, partial [Myxococcota bacterium]|nr:DUF58 domain-containing protein [Myxococcota bacterium]